MIFSKEIKGARVQGQGGRKGLQEALTLRSTRREPSTST